MTDEAVKNKLIRGVGPVEKSRIPLIQYADDTFFFCEASKKFVRNLKFLWQLFEWASGFKVKNGKSELFYTGRSERKAAKLARILECKIGVFPTKYLGLPLSNKKLRKEDWNGVINNVFRRIDGWQAKLLSRGGRLTLVNAVLANIPIYLCSIFKAPTWVTKRIEALRRDFFWFGDVQRSGMGRLVAWKNVCRSKAEGGLGILDLSSMNDALLVKWWWRLIFSIPELQWNKLIRALYYSRRKPLWEGRTFGPFSPWWQGVVRSKEIFRGGVSYRLGNGKNINFWSDRWRGEKTLQSLFPEVFVAVERKGVSVGECFGRDRWRWRKILRGATTSGQRRAMGVRQLREFLAGVTLGSGNDGVVWRWHENGLFTVKSTYAIISDGGTRDLYASSLWRLRMPLKVQILVWLILKNRLLTADNLSRRGWVGNTLYMLCGCE